LLRTHVSTTDFQSDGTENKTNIFSFCMKIDAYVTETTPAVNQSA